MTFRGLRVLSLGLVALLLGTTAEANLLRGPISSTAFPCFEDQAECNKFCERIANKCSVCPHELGGGWMCLPGTSPTGVVKAAPEPLAAAPTLPCFGITDHFNCDIACRHMFDMNCVQCPDDPTKFSCSNVVEVEPPLLEKP
eukprot:RCo019070